MMAHFPRFSDFQGKSYWQQCYVWRKHIQRLAPGKIGNIFENLCISSDMVWSSWIKTCRLLLVKSWQVYHVKWCVINVTSRINNSYFHFGQEVVIKLLLFDFSIIFKPWLPFWAKQSWSDLPGRVLKQFELWRRSPQSLRSTLDIFASSVFRFHGTFSMLCVTFHIQHGTSPDSYLPWARREPAKVNEN